MDVCIRINSGHSQMCLSVTYIIKNPHISSFKHPEKSCFDTFQPGSIPSASAVKEAVLKSSKYLRNKSCL